MFFLSRFPGSTLGFFLFILQPLLLLYLTLLLLPSSCPPLILGSLLSLTICYPLFQRGHRWAFCDGSAVGGDDVLDNVALVLGCRPSGDNRDNIAGSEGCVGIMNKVMLGIGKPLEDFVN